MSDTRHVPAFRADNGNVCAIGTITSLLKYAQEEADSKRSPEDRMPIFVAYRDLPDWRPVGQNPWLDAEGNADWDAYADNQPQENHSGYYEQHATCAIRMMDENFVHACYRDPSHTDEGRRDDDAHICLCGTVWENRRGDMPAAAIVQTTE